MATSRPFKYNPTGATISGTLQVGSVSVALESIDFSGGGWWNGPDEDLGYVIAKPVPLGNQDTPVPGDNLILSTTYKGVNINLSNSNQTAFQQFGYQMSVLGETLISGTDKVMFSILSTSLEPLTLPQSRFIGVGNTSMNYLGNPYGGYPGNDTNSIGFNAIGEYFYNGSVVLSGLPTWTQGDVIDIAISHGQYWWIRVNGGYWNNSNTADPSTNSGGLTMSGKTNYYPALCPGYEGTMKVLNVPKYGWPTGYNFLGHTTASVGFLRSSSLTESSFLDLVSSQFNQVFTKGTSASTWLNSNGYWSSFTDIWQYNSGSLLGWTDDTTGYTLLTGGVNNNDDGFWINPITIPTYYMNNQTSSSLYVSTNAVVTLGVGYGNCCPSSPQASSNPALISGNAGDMFVNPGSSLTDGTTMNAYYRITQNGTRSKIELKIFQAILSAQSSPYSYQLNLYRDATYQWVETRVKSNNTGTVGPYNSTDVSQPASTVSGVWRGDLLGQNWVYMGTGTVTE